MALNYELSGAYSLRPFVSSMNQMLDITDDAFSLYRTVGNPDLKMQYTHEFQLNWNRRMKERAKWVGLVWEHSLECAQHHQCAGAHGGVDQPRAELCLAPPGISLQGEAEQEKA